MAQLQRPATLREFLIHSLLVWRDRDTLVDRDDDEPTTQLRRPDSDAPPAESPRSSRASFVFDLSAVPRGDSRPTLPAPAPAPWPAARARRRRPVVPAPPSSERHADLMGAILLALVVIAALVMAR
ncbi:MAG TPA: hypothetical protein VGL81_28600 [Polyangiaceae bacterium]|jgi:hypothetical protein